MCEHAIGQDGFDRLVDPVIHPSGIWADFNPILYYYEALQRLARAGVIDGNCLPPPPDPSQYSDLLSPRSESIWGEAREPFGILHPPLR